MKTIKAKKIGLSLEPLLTVSKERYIEIKVDKLVPGMFQPRKHFGKQELDELSASIKDNGVIQALSVRPCGDGFEIIAGERRWRAAVQAGLKTVPAVVKDISDEQALAFGVIENLQREDLNPIEEAFALKRLIEEFGMTHEEIAKSIGKSRSFVSNMLRLLKLTNSVQEHLIHGHIDMSQAKLLVGLAESEQDDACEYLVKNQLTARETERYLKSVKENKSTSKATHKHPQVIEWERKIEYMLSMKTKVNVDGNGRGKIEISVNDAYQIIQLIDSLS